MNQSSGDRWNHVDLTEAARLRSDQALARLSTSDAGLSVEEANRRIAIAGPNALREHAVRPAETLLRQLNNPLLLLLVAAVIVSITVGEHTDAAIILTIIVLTAGLGFINENRSERAVHDLHSKITRNAMVVRNGRTARIDVTSLVPGDIVILDVGSIVPADVRILAATGFECDEAILTGESAPALKTPNPESDAGGFQTCAFMGTVVRGGTARAVVVSTGASTALGRIAHGLGTAPPQTAFQRGLRSYSTMLVWATTILTIAVFAANALLHHPLFESLLFSLAIAVGLTPQLLPAIVTICLSTGAQRMAKRGALVKRLVCIEDLGNVEVLYTDKTGTLTDGRIEFAAALDPDGEPSLEVLRLGLLCNSAAGDAAAGTAANSLDAAILVAPNAASAGADRWTRLAELSFDFNRRMMSVLVRDESGNAQLVVKGAPESVFARCADAKPKSQVMLDDLFSAGKRVVAVAIKPAGGLSAVSAEDERELSLAGFLVFSDPQKAGAAQALERLRALGIEVKIATGDNERVAQKLCADMGFSVDRVMTGAQIDALDDDDLRAAIRRTTIFARVNPEIKARLIRIERALDKDVAFLGDGVNDAIALHDADVGISVESAADVAKDAADIVLLEKDLGMLADGVIEGRRIFANTIKYVLMGTSSNFGNMFSTAAGSLFLPFLPMLPSQILLNNLLYDVSEMTIPTDRVDEELLQRPSHWDTPFIRRFMLFFGPINSIFDFVIFGVMLWFFHAGAALFQSGFFVENFLTQTLVIFAIRTRRVPLFRSRPSVALAATTLGCAAIGGLLPFTPLGRAFGFAPLPAAFFAVLMVIILTAYFSLVEVGKMLFFRGVLGPAQSTKSERGRRLRRAAAKFVAWR